MRQAVNAEPEEDEDEPKGDLFEELFLADAVQPIEGMPSIDWIWKNFKTKSGAIRYLDSLGFKAKDIAAHLRIRYQHVRNVTTKELKRGPTEVYHTTDWKCPHTKEAFVEVVVRTGVRDAGAGHILYRVCVNCAKSSIPGVDEEALKKAIPGAYKP